MFLSYRRIFSGVFFTLLISFIFNNNLTKTLYQDAVKRNELIIRKSKLNDEILMCKAFSLNTSYFKTSDCEIIKNSLAKIEKELNNKFKLLNLYIKCKGKVVETKKNI